MMNPNDKPYAFKQRKQLLPGIGRVTSGNRVPSREIISPSTSNSLTFSKYERRPNTSPSPRRSQKFTTENNRDEKVPSKTSQDDNATPLTPLVANKESVSSVRSKTSGNLSPLKRKSSQTSGDITPSVPDLTQSPDNSRPLTQQSSKTSKQSTTSDQDRARHSGDISLSHTVISKTSESDLPLNPKISRTSGDVAISSRKNSRTSGQITPVKSQTSRTSARTSGYTLNADASRISENNLPLNPEISKTSREGTSSSRKSSISSDNVTLVQPETSKISARNSGDITPFNTEFSKISEDNLPLNPEISKTSREGTSTFRKSTRSSDNVTTVQSETTKISPRNSGYITHFNTEVSKLLEKDLSFNPETPRTSREVISPSRESSKTPGDVTPVKSQTSKTLSKNSGDITPLNTEVSKISEKDFLSNPEISRNSKVGTPSSRKSSRSSSDVRPVKSEPSRISNNTATGRSETPRTLEISRTPETTRSKTSEAATSKKPESPRPSVDTKTSSNSEMANNVKSKSSKTSEAATSKPSVDTKKSSNSEMAENAKSKRSKTSRTSGDITSVTPGTRRTSDMSTSQKPRTSKTSGSATLTIPEKGTGPPVARSISMSKKESLGNESSKIEVNDEAPISRKQRSKVIEASRSNETNGETNPSQKEGINYVVTKSSEEGADLGIIIENRDDVNLESQHLSNEKIVDADNDPVLERVPSERVASSLSPRDSKVKADVSSPKKTSSTLKTTPLSSQRESQTNVGATISKTSSQRNNSQEKDSNRPSTHASTGSLKPTQEMNKTSSTLTNYMSASSRIGFLNELTNPPETQASNTLFGRFTRYFSMLPYMAPAQTQPDYNINLTGQSQSMKIDVAPDHKGSVYSASDSRPSGFNQVEKPVQNSSIANQDSKPGTSQLYVEKQESRVTESKSPITYTETADVRSPSTAQEIKKDANTQMETDYGYAETQHFQPFLSNETRRVEPEVFKLATQFPYVRDEPPPGKKRKGLHFPFDRPFGQVLSQPYKRRETRKSVEWDNADYRPDRYSTYLDPDAFSETSDLDDFDVDGEKYDPPPNSYPNSSDYFEDDDTQIPNEYQDNFRASHQYHTDDQGPRGYRRGTQDQIEYQRRTQGSIQYQRDTQNASLYQTGNQSPKEQYRRSQGTGSFRMSTQGPGEYRIDEQSKPRVQFDNQYTSKAMAKPPPTPTRRARPRKQSKSNNWTPGTDGRPSPSSSAHIQSRGPTNAVEQRTGVILLWVTWLLGLDQFDSILPILQRFLFRVLSLWVMSTFFACLKQQLFPPIPKEREMVSFDDLPWDK